MPYPSLQPALRRGGALDGCASQTPSQYSHAPRTPFFVLIAAAAAYVLLSFFTFHVPQTLSDGELCGFVAGDFARDGTLAYPPLHAWWLSFVRKQEYWTTLSVSLAVGFIAYALQVGRRAGASRKMGSAAGAAAGSGILALSALCVSCLAPVLSAVGLGLAGTLLAGVPKWLIAFNTLLLTGWGSLVLSRRITACPLPPPSSSPSQSGIKP
jgi:hypothetical protein